ncbi:hypothetical protein SO802_013610 [Lithocarpus litseifolius]|uniref:DUF7746 domain-containing protein n=1 Tax=Lithocarpus litseifolius TaxID=425828 RepID=A0AAW2D7J1_9ROSI
MSFTKNWYTKPTPPDMQFEERIFQSQFSVSADKLYEWNIDGFSEQQIINKMGHMSMVAITYMNNHDLDHPEIVDLLSTGFIGTLRGLPIFDEKRNSGIPDGVNTLIHTILKHFVGTLTNVSSRVSDYLNNLRCPTMSDYSKDCKAKPGKFKSKLNMLNINDKDQEDLIRILESNNSSDSLEDDLSSSDSCYHSADESSDSPNIKLGCRDSCCNTITSINTLTKHEENEKLLISLINQIQNPELQKEYLDRFKKNLTKTEDSKKLKSTISFEEVLERFNKKKPKELTIEDLKQKLTIVEQNIEYLRQELRTVKLDNININQELLILKMDKSIDKHQSDNEQDEPKDGDDSNQQALLSDTESSLRTLAAITNTTSKWIYATTCKWNIMTSSAERRNKGKGPAVYPQDERLPAGQPFVMHEGASSRRNPSRSTSLQEIVPAEVTFSSGDMHITLQEVISKTLQFHNGNFSDLPIPVKILIDNLHAAYINSNRKLFKKTLQALEIHFVNLAIQNDVYENLIIKLDSQIQQNPVNQPLPLHEAFASHSIHQDPYTSQLSGKEEIHSMDKMTLMGTDYAKLSLKTQFSVRCAVANLPSDIQKCIFESKAMFTSFDLWYDYFKKLVTASIPDPDELDVDDNVFIQLDWEEYFGTSARVYERKIHPFPGLLVNYEDDELDEEDMNPNWLSQMFEFGFIRMIRVSNRDQLNQLPQIIQQVVARTKSPSVTIRCWSTLPKWDTDNWMNVQPSKHLVLVNGYTHQGPWYKGDSFLSYKSPYSLAECWRNYFNNQILEVIQNLWKDYHFEGNTDRITVFGLKPYGVATQHISIADYINPRNFTNPLKEPIYEHLLYCGFCNQYTTYHEHDCDNEPTWDPRDNYSDYCDTN